MRTLTRTRPELSDFLRRHREGLSPAELGLPSGGRRRTPGLRREEVAALAGVGITWYTWFEQGRGIGVSEAFLLRIAKILSLDDAECCHLFLLARQRPPPPEARHWPSVPPLAQQMMDELPARPAYVTNLRWDVVAWNAAADRLFGFARLEPPVRNLLRLVFADPDLRRRLPEWQQDAPRIMTGFRQDLALAPEDPAMLALVDELKKLSPDFRRWWRAPPAGRHARGIAAVTTKGQRIDFGHAMLVVDEHRHLRMTVYFAEKPGRPPSAAAVRPRRG